MRVIFETLTSTAADLQFELEMGRVPSNVQLRGLDHRLR